MAVAIDDTIARVSVSGGSAATTDVFDTTASDLLIVSGSFDHSGGSASADPTISDNSGGAITWTSIAIRDIRDASSQDGQVALWYAVPGARTGLTVTITRGNGFYDSPSIKVLKATGFDPADPIGAQTEGSSTSANFDTTAITPETTGAVVVAGTDWGANGSPSSGNLRFGADGDFLIVSNIAGLTGYLLGSVGEVQAGVALQANIANTSPQWNYIVAEIRLDPGVPPRRWILRF
jgi:hypothetical protein